MTSEMGRVRSNPPHAPCTRTNKFACKPNLSSTASLKFGGEIGFKHNRWFIGGEAAMSLK
jgi:hypothetical protein